LWTTPHTLFTPPTHICYLVTHIYIVTGLRVTHYVCYPVTDSGRKDGCSLLLVVIADPHTYLPRLDTTFTVRYDSGGRFYLPLHVAQGPAGWDPDNLPPFLAPFPPTAPPPGPLVGLFPTTTGRPITCTVDYRPHTTHTARACTATGSDSLPHGLRFVPVLLVGWFVTLLFWTHAACRCHLRSLRPVHTRTL